MKNSIKVSIGVVMILLLIITAEGCRQKAPPENKQVRARTKMAPIEYAIGIYKKDTGQLPGRLKDLLSSSAGKGETGTKPYLRQSQINDPWNKMYIYEPNGNNIDGYDLKSFGADGLPGGIGDNADITKESKGSK